MIAAGFPVAMRDQSAAAPTTGLHIAAREGAWLNVRLLLEAGVDANSGGTEWEIGDAEGAEAAEVEGMSEDDKKLFHFEFLSGESNAEHNIEMIRAREARASPPPPPPHVPDTPLSLAAGNGQHHCASELVLAGCAIDMPVRKHKVTVRVGCRYLPPLLYARHHPFGGNNRKRFLSHPAPALLFLDFHSICILTPLPHSRLLPPCSLRVLTFLHQHACVMCRLSGWLPSQGTSARSKPSSLSGRLRSRKAPRASPLSSSVSPYPLVQTHTFYQLVHPLTLPRVSLVVVLCVCVCVYV